jgi:hypothetical protein
MDRALIVTTVVRTAYRRAPTTGRPVGPRTPGVGSRS